MKKYSNDNIFLNSMNDLTRQAYDSDNFQPKNDKPINNSSPFTRFETDLFINKKDEFENNNSKINQLNDEIILLKRKLKVVSEKDTEIQELQNEIQDLKIDLQKKENNITSLSSKLNEFNQMKSQYIQLKKENDQYQIDLMKLESLKTRNKVLQEKIIELSSKLDLSNSTSDNCLSDNDIKIDIEQIKTILNNRLKTYHEEHIQKLIDEYELSKKEYISKDILTELLNKAIHI